eukprot:GCRY01002843.1.p1 GENE.GCRY01002843.1~~GCRY01002843.1.p1  ORF type:complete len:301 (+),score=19.64 GCRY01002843.1:109-903(+)
MNSKQKPVAVQYFYDYLHLIQLKECMKECVGGTYVSPNPKKSDEWSGVMFVRQGPYSGGVFKFQIQFPPQGSNKTQLPAVVFTPPIFHPLINPQNGNFELKDKFKEWNAVTSKIVEILAYMKDSFYQKIDSSQPANEYAYKLQKDDYEEFEKHATIVASESNSRVYDEDNSTIKFSPFNDDHEEILNRIQRRAKQTLTGQSTIQSNTSLAYLNSPARTSKFSVSRVVSNSPLPSQPSSTASAHKPYSSSRLTQPPSSFRQPVFS